MGQVPEIGCRHTATKNALLCRADLLTDADLAMNYDKFYADPNKVSQDQFILSPLDVSDPKRRRPRVENENVRKNRNLNVKYTLLTENHPKKIKLCKATFIKVLGKFYSL